MNPPMIGPTTGPRKGLAVKINMGACKLLLSKRSPTVPPDTERKAAPENPSMNLPTSMVAMFSATAQGINHIRNMNREVMYIGFLP